MKNITAAALMARSKEFGNDLMDCLSEDQQKEVRKLETKFLKAIVKVQLSDNAAPIVPVVALARMFGFELDKLRDKGLFEKEEAQSVEVA
jgi:hypothetical protein